MATESKTARKSRATSSKPKVLLGTCPCGGEIAVAKVVKRKTRMARVCMKCGSGV
jgi:hypothetical protein